MTAALRDKDPNPLTEKLRPHVAALEAAAAKGDTRAREVIVLYRMYIRCPRDPGAYGLCHAAFDDWLRVEEFVDINREENR
jgi:hypothetical protein